MTGDRRDDQDLERKLHAYFRAETDDLGLPDTLWEEMSGRLGKQDNPRWYMRRPSFRSYATRRVLAAIILLLGMLTVIFFLFQMAPEPDVFIDMPGNAGGDRRLQGFVLTVRPPCAISSTGHRGAVALSFKQVLHCP